MSYNQITQHVQHYTHYTYILNLLARETYWKENDAESVVIENQHLSL